MLKQYKKKRDFKKTPEPKARLNKSKDKHIFVVQKHAASHLHYDFRLEAGGVLLSWAVPKGPSVDPHVKRLAIMVEDHPFDYKDFEGIIPKGQYGAGQVIVWDNGTYVPADAKKAIAQNTKEADKIVAAGLKTGKLTFVLQGKKLKGEWTLVRTKQDRQWLLIKHEDKYADETDITKLDRSVISKRTIASLKSKGNKGVRNENRKH